MKWPHFAIRRRFYPVFVILINDFIIFSSVSFYYEFSKEQDYICSRPEDSGMHLCSELPQYRVGAMLCNGKFEYEIENR